VNERQSRSERACDSSPVITVEPVVVKPEMDSNAASTTPRVPVSR